MGAEQARARTPFASPAGDSAIRRPRRSGCARLCALRARTARIRLRDGRGCWWRVSTQSASPHRSPVGGGRGRGCRITRLGRHTERVLSSCTHARARRVGRGGNERAHTARAIASRGRIGGGARCMPRGRGRRPRGRGRVTGARGSHNDKGAILGGFWDAWKAARKCDFFFAKRVCRVLTNFSARAHTERCCTNAEHRARMLWSSPLFWVCVQGGEGGLS